MAAVAVLMASVVVLGAWTYEQTFESLTDGDLTAQDSWSGSTAFDVQSSVAYGGTKAVSVVIGAGAQGITRAITDIADGDVYFALRRTTNSGGGEAWVILRDGSDANKIFIRMGSDGNISGYHDTTAAYVAVLSGYAANTWYPINVQFNDSTQPDQFRLRVYSSGAWGSFSSWLTVLAGSYVNIGSILLETEDGNDGTTAYIDSFTASDPTGGGGGGGSPLKSLTLTGVGGELR